MADLKFTPDEFVRQHKSLSPSPLGDSDFEKYPVNSQIPSDEHHITKDELKGRGVARIEALKSTMDRKYLIIFALSIFLTAWVSTLDSSTTYNYQPYATSSFNRHSMISTVTVANQVISAVSKPFIAKLSDFSSRPATYILILVLYTIGFIITACSPSIAAYVIGSVFIAIGQSGVDLMNSIVIADMSPLKWRAFFSSLMSLPYLVTTWISGYIVSDIVSDNWRWGYGMFCIITPLALTPAIIVMFWLENKAQKEGKVPLGADPFLETKRRVDSKNVGFVKGWTELIVQALIEIDAIGLVLIGFAFSLILLPLSLYPYAERGFNNPSMIAMEVVGGIFLIAYIVYDVWFAPYPLLPKRVLFNRTFICCVIIDFIYQFAGYMPLLYFSSYTMVVLNISTQNWVYLSNTTTMGLCGFGILWGLTFRVFRRYKVFQVTGLAVKLIGMGLYVKCSTYELSPSLGIVVASLIVTSLGDAASVVGTQVAAQAAVPHQDVAATISVLSLYVSIGAGIGSAVTSTIWTSKLPGALMKYVPDSTKAAAFFEDLTLIKAEPWDSPDRIGAIQAYQSVLHILFCMGLGISSLCFIFALFQTNFYLGDQQNAVEGKQVEDYDHNDDGSKKTLVQRMTDFTSKPFN